MTSSLRLSMASTMLLAAAALGYMVLSGRQPAVVEVPQALQVSYLVSTHPLPAGTLMREEDIASQTMASAKLPISAITDTPLTRASLRGALVRTYIDPGKPIMADDVLRPRDRGFLATVLAPGTRAISIAVDAVSGVSGLIWPGDHVDVVLTQNLTGNDIGHRTVSETILYNIRVIAIDQEITQGAPSSNTTAGKVARTVTLQVDPTQVEHITVAESLGKLALSIHAATDTATPISTGRTFGSEVSSVLETPASGGKTIRVIEGNTTREMTFGAGQ